MAHGEEARARSEARRLDREAVVSGLRAAGRIRTPRKTLARDGGG